MIDSQEASAIGEPAVASEDESVGPASPRSSGKTIRPRHTLHALTHRSWPARLRYQLLVGLFLSVIAPILIYVLLERRVLGETPSANTVIGATAAFLVTTYLFRRAITLPGFGMLSHVMPAAAAGYGLAVAVFFGLRLEYSRVTFFASFCVAVLFFFMVSIYLRNQRGQRFYLVPSPATRMLATVPGLEWILLDRPSLPEGEAVVVVADLRAELDDDWERLIADAAVGGHPVYHVKQIVESLTGQVEIEHLSENSFGSLLPNLIYRKIKRLADLLSAIVLLPLLFLPGLLVAAIIMLDSPGPPFFRQERRGYRGQIFRVLKFRTMFHRGAEAPPDATQAAITQSHDPRITRVGRFLRRTRIDELPQVWNVLKGEMSWIGPRPEALTLSQWYMNELPFYHYRHIVRPGITGWAQVNQGHVADLEQVSKKLHYDFYYIKNYSAWLDILILGRTISIVLSGFGAK